MNYIKTALAALGAWLAVSLGIYAPWMIILVAAIVLDYITGMTAAAYTGELNSRKGIRGILKKLGYLALVGLGFMIDWVVAAGVAQFGWSAYPEGIIALAVIAWIIINEALSIVENLGRLEVPIPKFLKKVVKSLHSGLDNMDGGDTHE